MVNSCDVKVDCIGWCRGKICLVHVCHYQYTALVISILLTNILLTNHSTMQLHCGIQPEVFLRVQQIIIASKQKDERLKYQRLTALQTISHVTKGDVADMLMLQHALG